MASSGDSAASINFIALTAEIVSAYVGNNTVAQGDIPALIQQIHQALLRVAGGQQETSSEPLKPAVPVKKSIHADYIVCLEDGKKFKSLKRHLRTQYEMTPEQYRDKWNLPADYPMVAPNYAKHRSSLAKKIGLGTKPRASGRRCRTSPSPPSRLLRWSSSPAWPGSNRGRSGSISNT